MTNDMPSVIWVQRNKCSSDVHYNAWDTNDTEFCETKYVLSDEADELRRQRDEALQALQLFVDAHQHNVYSNLTYAPYVEARRILAQYDKDGNA